MRFAQAKIDEWLFWEQYSHEPYVAVCRLPHGLPRPPQRTPVSPGGSSAPKPPSISWTARSRGRDWLAGDAMSIADICLLPYTRLAPEGGFDLSGRQSLCAWIERCEKQLGLDKAQA